MRKRRYHRRTNNLSRSYDSNVILPASNPYCMLASAIIFQAAVDCDNWTPEIEDPQINTSGWNGLQYQRKSMLVKFINSDWIDVLLSWQHDITPEGVCEELVRRLQHD